ncbi:MAG: hypothetical protein JSV49_09740 [Thermoplasmata archaeon]|nr:MAG: hypothetical protein JSV49_09740 [Thermoplasmata archaeon]
MKKEKTVQTILIISVVLNIIFISSIIYIIYGSADEEPELKESESVIEEFEYGTYVLEYNEPFQVGDYVLFYSSRDWSITLVDIETNETMGHFWEINRDKIKGFRGYQFNITEITPYNVTLTFYPYNETDYLGQGVYFFPEKEYNKSFNFGGNEILIWRDYNNENDTGEFEVITDEGSTIIWVSGKRQCQLGFINIALRGGYGIECTLRKYPEKLT